MTYVISYGKLLKSVYIYGNFRTRVSSIVIIGSRGLQINTGKIMEGEEKRRVQTSRGD